MGPHLGNNAHSYGHLTIHIDITSHGTTFERWDILRFTWFRLTLNKMWKLSIAKIMCLHNIAIMLHLLEQESVY
jgi:hypothetical protein